MKLPIPPSPFKKLRIHGESLTVDTSRNTLVIPTGNPDILPSFNEYVLNPNKLSISESPFSGHKTTSDYLPGSVSIIQGENTYIDAGTLNSKKSLSAGQCAAENIFLHNKKIIPDYHPTALAPVAPYNVSFPYTDPSLHGGSLEFINTGNNSRVRQTGQIKKIKFAVPFASQITDFRVKIWRKTNNTYTVVSETENIASVLSDGINEITLTSPISAEYGDFYGVYLSDLSVINAVQFCDADSKEILTSEGSNFYCSVPTLSVSSVTGGTILSYSNSPNYHTGDSTDWIYEIDTHIDKQFTVLLYMDSPAVVFIGDSTIAGVPGNTNFTSNVATHNPLSDPCRIYSLIANTPCQNMAIGGQSTAQIAARFENDVVSLNPMVAVIEGGLNTGDAILTEQGRLAEVAAFESMIQLCEANNIYPVLYQIPPRTGDTLELALARNTLNNDLKALQSTHDFHIFENRSALGNQGANEQWSIKSAYDSDGVHYKITGYTQMANRLYADINFGRIRLSDFTLRNDSISDEVTVIEILVPDTLTSGGVTFECFNGYNFEMFAVYNLVTGTKLFEETAKLQTTTNTTLDSVHGVGLGRTFYAVGTRGQTPIKNGDGSDITYSSYYGTPNRIAFSLKLPASSSVRLRITIPYASDLEGVTGTTYQFSNDFNEVTGLKTISKPWIALYDPASYEMYFYLFTYRPQNFEFKRDDEGVIRKLILYPGNGNIYYGKITHALLTQDSNSDSIPDCLDSSIEGSITRFLQAYGSASGTLGITQFLTSDNQDFSTSETQTLYVRA